MERGGTGKKWAQSVCTCSLDTNSQHHQLHTSSTTPTHNVHYVVHFLPLVEDILDKLRQDPGSITTDDARRLSENAVVGDLRTTRIVAAVKAFAAHNEGIYEVSRSMYTSRLSMH
jgi:hypothetical protein